jgi:hypothetical protein
VRLSVQILCLGLGLFGVLRLGQAQADSVPFWGAKSSVSIDTTIDKLKKGEFVWIGDAFTSGPVAMVMSITEQKAYVYRNGILIGATTVSAGRPGHLTPTGVFTVLQKQKEHRSTIYDLRRRTDAPHGTLDLGRHCAARRRTAGLPRVARMRASAKRVCKAAIRHLASGMTVVIASDATAPESVAHPGYLAPVSYVGGKPVDALPLSGADDERWEPELSPNGPLSIVIGQVSQRMIVYRNGIEVGRAKITVTGDQPLIPHALVLAQGQSITPDPYVPDSTKFRWTRVGVPGQLGLAGTDADPTAIARIKVPSEFVSRVNSILTTGTTLFVTNEALSTDTSGPMVQVVDANPPAKKR